MTGSNEILLDDSKIFYNRIRTIQKNTTLSVYENQNHVWLLSDSYVEASKKAQTEMRKFFNKFDLTDQCGMIFQGFAIQ